MYEGSNVCSVTDKSGGRLDAGGHKEARACPDTCALFPAVSAVVSVSHESSGKGLKEVVMKNLFIVLSLLAVTV